METRGRVDDSDEEMRVGVVEVVVEADIEMGILLFEAEGDTE